MPSLRLRCKIHSGERLNERIAAVEKAANAIRRVRSCFLRVVPTEGGVFCDLYLHGARPLDPGVEFALRTTGERFTREIIG